MPPSHLVLCDHSGLLYNNANPLPEVQMPGVSRLLRGPLLIGLALAALVASGPAESACTFSRHFYSFEQPTGPFSYLETPGVSPALSRFRAASTISAKSLTRRGFTCNWLGCILCGPQFRLVGSRKDSSLP